MKLSYAVRVCGGSNGVTICLALIARESIAGAISGTHSERAGEYFQLKYAESTYPPSYRYFLKKSVTTAKWQPISISGNDKTILLRPPP